MPMSMFFSSYPAKEPTYTNHPKPKRFQGALGGYHASQGLARKSCDRKRAMPGASLGKPTVSRKIPSYEGIFLKIFGENGYAIFTSIVTPDGRLKFVSASITLGVGSRMSITRL